MSRIAAPARSPPCGADAVRRAGTALFAASPDGVFTAEEVVPAGDRVVVRWRYDFGDGHVRGTDLFAVRGGLVVEKLAYVKEVTRHPGGRSTMASCSGP